MHGGCVMFGIDIKSAIITGLLGAMIGFAACFAVHALWLDPALVKATTETVTDQVTKTVTAERDLACLQVTSEAERAARLAAEARQMAAIDKALLAYERAAEESAAQSASEIAILESEIRTYEAKLKKLGHSCPLGADDYRFIYGDGVQLPEPAGQ